MSIGMENQERKTLGIIGGMGPSATALLFQKIIELTDAGMDAEHIHIIIDNNPTIPDRTTAILNHDNTPAIHICESGKKLEKCGAQVLVIPCNTSHYFLPYIREKLNIPVINMLEETAKECVACGYTKVGVLATTGTRNTQIYEKELEKCGITTVYPDQKGQEQVMEIIYDQVKAGKTVNTSIIKSQLDIMTQNGVQAFILGCTELPIVLKDGDYGYRFIDTLEVLAKSAITSVGYRVKEYIKD